MIYRGRLFIAPHEINACKKLALELLYTIEGRGAKLIMPKEEGLERMLQLINNPDDLLLLYAENKTALFEIMRDLLSDPRANPYREHCFRTLLQNYVLYILYFNFEDIYHLVDYFEGTPLWCQIIINRMFTDAIFIQKIMKQNCIDITKCYRVTVILMQRLQGYIYNRRLKNPAAPSLARGKLLL